MRKVYFLFGIHNHQPVGNFPDVLEKAYQDAYAPFLEAMSRHPRIKWSLHCTGILWDYIVDRHPEYVHGIKKMVDAGQIELLTGGYYEPILSVIPDRDKKGQIKKLTAFIERTFQREAKGMWLAERVWEPQLAKAIAEAGVSYTVVDDAHFSSAGCDVERLRGYYVTEEQGVKLNIFPISQRLRYYIPFQNVEKTIEYLSSCARENEFPALVMADDGEKFGLWPETYKHVYVDGWLDRFLTALEQNLDWIEPVTFSEYMAKAPSEGRIYLPTASYFEMSEWSLPDDAQEAFEGVVRQCESRPDVKRFLKGGFWRNFLSKYAESNNMHKKMLLVSEKLHKLKEQEGTKKSHSLSSLARAFDHLYAGQCNCAYWHGVFGGLYLPHLRSAVYEELLKAEALHAEGSSRKAQCRYYDFDGDGREEILFEGKHQNLYLSPHNGGTMFEWDLLDKKVNLLNVLTRRKEAYHQRLREFLSNPPHAAQGVQTIHDLVKVKEQNLDRYLHYDWYRRASLVDHFPHPDTDLEAFSRGQYGEQGDFVLGGYCSEISARSISLRREGRVWENQVPLRVEVLKEIVPAAAGMKICYRIRNAEGREISLLFVPEFNFAFSYRTEEDAAAREKVTEWVRRDEGFKFMLKMSFSSEITVWAFPLETVSLSEGGFERTYQGTVVLPVYRLKIPAQDASTFDISVALSNL